MKKVLLVSNRVMHYRVPVYNYFWRRFQELGWDFVVRSNQLQKENPHPLEFDFKEIPLEFSKYRAEIARLNPDVVIVFLRLKDLLVWPLVHWLKARGTPVAFWMKAMNYDKPDSLTSRLMYRYMHAVFDGLILYSEHEIGLIPPRSRRKAFPANNTINFESYPEVRESREEIKRELGIPFEKVVLSVGRMGAGGQRKKVHHLIEIFRDVEMPGVGLVIVGSGMSAELLQRLNPSNTVYLGEVHDPGEVQVSKIFKMADVFSIPGHVGLGLNQAFYWGLPVVTEDWGQPPEINYLINSRNGFLVPKDDREALKNRILELLRDDAKRREFSANARHDIMTNASIEGMFRGFKACVESLTPATADGLGQIVPRGES
jgi:glycosyltransferase involved in cell wall biosynthesis